MDERLEEELVEEIEEGEDERLEAFESSELAR